MSPCTSGSSLYFPTTVASCLPQTHQAHYLPRALAFVPVYPKCASFRHSQHTLLNIEVTFLARTTSTNTSGTSTLLFQPLSIPISCFLQNASYLKLACFFIYCSSVCLPPHNVASVWSRPCLFWSPKYPQSIIPNSLQTNTRMCWIWMSSIHKLT